MRRRSFLSTSVLGTGGLILNSCSVPKNITGETGNKISGHSIQASTPPLGWNSFDSYGVYLHHDAAMANIKAMAEKLKPFGYEYFVIDAGWYGEFKLVPGTIYPAEKHASEVRMDEFGIYQPSSTYFSKGFHPIVDYAHQMGLKAGIHLMRGIPRKAVDLNLPVKNSKYRAADIADKDSICTWNNHNYGVDTSKPGAQDWYDSVYSQIAEWGFDMVKVDDLTPYPKEIVAIADAIEKTNRKMILSLSPGGGVYLPDITYYKRANMVRTSSDIWDRQEDIDKGFEAWKKFSGLAHEGFWPDLDMIPFGQLQLMSPAKFDSGKDNNVDLAGLGNTRFSDFSRAQMRTFITMRSLAASPLFAGGDIPTLDDYSLSLLTNQEMLACNQNGECARNVYEIDGIEVWVTQEKNRPGKGWLGVFNRNSQMSDISLSYSDLGFMKFINGYKLVPKTGPFRMMDIWNNKTFLLDRTNLQVTLESNDVYFLKFNEN